MLTVASLGLVFTSLINSLEVIQHGDTSLTAALMVGIIVEKGMSTYR